MANQPFDTTIINPLERPKSSDINAAQSELRRSLLDYLQHAFATSYGADSLSTTTRAGFIGNGFAVTASSPASMVVNIAPGMGFGTGAQDANVTGIVGLNDLSFYKPLYLSAGKAITVPTAPGAGFCRRDAIYVHVSRQLTDATLSDVYSTALGVFTPQTINKTMTFDLAGQTPQVIEAGSGASWTSAIVYAKGANTAYTTEDDLLNAPITNAPLFQGWFRIAVINLYPNATFINDEHIADWRLYLTANGVLDIVGSATLGGGNDTTAPYSSPIISNLSMRTPAGVRACLSHPVAAGGAQNQYTMTVLSASGTNITGFFTTANILSRSNSDPYGFPISVATLSRVTGGYVNSALKATILASAQTSPNMLVAIGQPIQQLNFAIGYHDTAGGSSVKFITGDASYTNASPLNQDTIDVSFNIKVTV